MSIKFALGTCVAASHRLSISHRTHTDARGACGWSAALTWLAPSRFKVVDGGDASWLFEILWPGGRSRQQLHGDFPHLLR